ncbi:hypothetical protein ACNQVK_03115 [Mycobacterium sp. 134]|uniref:hypothetical protein n=1 Tax=Mycobacterium sp. 134 TaxID=3400425 RepID=UPI003AADC512
MAGYVLDVGTEDIGVVVARMPGVEPFRIIDQAFSKWVEDLGEELESELPNPAEFGAGVELARLVTSAQEAGVLDGDPRLNIAVNGDDEYGPDGVDGYYVLVDNKSAGYPKTSLTSGWREVCGPLEGTPPCEAARFYLDMVCDEANTVLQSPVCAPVSDWRTMVVIHQADRRFDPAVVLCPSETAALSRLRDDFSDELTGREIADDDLLGWLDRECSVSVRIAEVHTL